MLVAGSLHHQRVAVHGADFTTASVAILVALTLTVLDEEWLP